LVHFFIFPFQLIVRQCASLPVLERGSCLLKLTPVRNAVEFSPFQHLFAVVILLKFNTLVRPPPKMRLDVSPFLSPFPPSLPFSVPPPYSSISSSKVLSHSLHRMRPHLLCVFLLGFSSLSCSPLLPFPIRFTCVSYKIFPDSVWVSFLPKTRQQCVPPPGFPAQGLSCSNWGGGRPLPLPLPPSPPLLP